MNPEHSNDRVFVSVIICTRNRCKSLARTLGSIARAAETVTEPWELIVVDNGSTDNTAAVVAEFCATLPLRLVTEQHAGLSVARNTGVEFARGTYILWTDDDVIVDEAWLRAWIAGFHANPESAVFGGRTEPLYDEPQRRWFIQSQPHLHSLLAIRDEPEWTDITVDRVPYGLNYAVRGTEQRRYKYDPELGVAPGRRRGGEEVALIRQILADGGRGRWIWDATVRHVISADRQTESYIRTFYIAMGYVHPFCGAPQNGRRSLRALAQIAVILTRSTISLLSTRLMRHRSPVPILITQSLAIGSLQRFFARTVEPQKIGTRDAGSSASL